MSWLLVLMLMTGETSPRPTAPAPPPIAGAHQADDGDPTIDARAFFALVVARYRDLQSYEDTTRVVRVTRRDGETPERVETHIGCAIEHGELRVETAAAALRRRVGLGLPVRVSPAMRQARLSYQLWMAPHMGLRYSSDEPASAVLGVTAASGLTATEADIVTIDERELVHVELTSPETEAREAGETTLDLYVNPDSMLVERILGQQRLPDGGNYETTLDITPLSAVSNDGWSVDHDTPVVEDGVVVEDPAAPVATPPDVGTPPDVDTPSVDPTVEPVAPPAIDPLAGPPGARPGA